MYTNTAYGDYPTLLPQYAQGKDFSKGLFTNWMLLNYNKPVQVSSTLGVYHSNYTVDEDIKTYWSAKTGNSGEWFQTDLEKFLRLMRFKLIMPTKMSSLWEKRSAKCISIKSMVLMMAKTGK